MANKKSVVNLPMVIVEGPLRIGLFPFQMAFFGLINRGDPNQLLTWQIFGSSSRPGKTRTVSQPLSILFADFLLM